MARPLRSVLAVALLAAVGAGTAVRAGDQPAPDRGAIAAAARDVIGKARYATFVTIDHKGQPQARIVDPFAPEDDWTIWAATSSRTRKAAELAANPRVTLLYFDAARASYVTVVGSARLVRDAGEKAKRWKEDWKPFYKDANRGDDYLLIRIVPERLEVVSTVLGMNNDPDTWRPVTLNLR